MMKFLLILLLFPIAVAAQNCAVKFYGTNVSGIPEYWPRQVQAIGTNTVVAPPFVLMTQEQLNDCVITNQPTYDKWSSNQTYAAQAKLDADLADFLAKMDKIETWIDRTSGTNSLTNAQRDSAINDICQTFKKLRRALVNLYKPE